MPWLQVVNVHTDEVWHVSFSNCGTMLATASKDKTAIIWSLRPGQLPSAAGAARPGSEGLGGGLGQLGRGPGEGEVAAQLLPHQVPARAFEAKGGAGQAGARGVGAAGSGGAQGGPQQPAALGQGHAAGQLHAQGQVPLVPIHVLQGHKVGLRFWAAPGPCTSAVMPSQTTPFTCCLSLPLPGFSALNPKSPLNLEP